MVVGSSFPSCSSSAAANVRVSSRQRRAGQGPKKAENPSPSARAKFQGQCLPRQRVVIEAVGIAAVDTPDSAAGIGRRAP